MGVLQDLLNGVPVDLSREEKEHLLEGVALEDWQRREILGEDQDRRDTIAGIVDEANENPVRARRRKSDGQSLVGLPDIRSRKSIIPAERYGELLNLNRAIDQHNRADAEMDRMLDAKVPSNVIDNETGLPLEMDAPIDPARVALIKTMLASAQYKIDKFLANPKPVEMSEAQERGARELNPLEMATKLAFLARRANIQKIDTSAGEGEPEVPEWLS